MVLSGVFSLGNAQVLAGGTYKFPLNVIPADATVRSLPITISGTIAASATHAYVGPASSSAQIATYDDLDAILASIFQSIDFRVATGFTSMSALSLLNTRSGFLYMNRQDISGPANGTSITTGGVPFTISINVPIELREESNDLCVMASGGERFQINSFFNFNYSAATGGNFTGTFSNSATTFTIPTSSLTVQVQSNQVDMGFGGGLVGALWELTAYSGAKTTDKTQPGIHLGFFDLGPGLQSGAYTPSVYNAWNGGPSIAQQATPGQLQITYRQQQTLYGPDPTLRMIPILSYAPKVTLGSINQSGSSIQYQITVGDTNSLTLMELIAHPATADELLQVAKKVGGGANVAVNTVAPPSMPHGNVSPASAALLPVAIANTAVAPASWPRLPPASVATSIANARTSSQGSANVAQSFGKVGSAAVRGR